MVLHYNGLNMKLTTLSALAALALLCGCGVKPSDVSPPPGHEKDGFPHVYPKPEGEAG
jgi:hypothetical protein